MNKLLTVCCSAVLFLLSGIDQVAGEQLESTSSTVTDTLSATTDGEVPEEISEESDNQEIQTMEDVQEETVGSQSEETALPVPLSGAESADTVDVNEVAGIDNTALLEAGKAKRGAGAALVSIGGVFIGGAMVYTVMFLIDEQTFGIPLGSTTSGNMMYSYYLNPGLFAIPIGAPCLALGIVNLIKGKNMISSARHAEGGTPLRVTPYLSYSLKKSRLNTGLVARF